MSHPEPSSSSSPCHSSLHFKRAMSKSDGNFITPSSCIGTLEEKTEDCRPSDPTASSRTLYPKHISTNSVGDDTSCKLLNCGSIFSLTSFTARSESLLNDVQSRKPTCTVFTTSCDRNKNRSSLGEDEVKPCGGFEKNNPVQPPQQGGSCSHSEAGDQPCQSLNESRSKIPPQAKESSLDVSPKESVNLQHDQHSLGDTISTTSHELGNIPLAVPSSSEKITSPMTVTESHQMVQSSYAHPALENLPRDVLLNIFQRLPTVSLIACATAHEAFDDVISEEKFLNMHTRSVLGFKINEKDISYDAIPAPVAPVQDLWFQLYLYRSAPNMVGIVRPGVVFYDLLCFKHLLDSWILQGLGYKYWMFVSDVLKSPNPPPLSFINCKRLIIISRRMLRVMTKVALCHPEILLLTLNDFETLSICASPPSDLDDAWTSGVPEEWKKKCDPEHTCEVVSRQRGLALASFFFTFDSNLFIGWSGLIDYSTFRWKDTWGLCKFLPDATLSEIKQVCQNFFQRFSDYVGKEYISVHCPNAFLYRGLIKIVQQREILLPTIQDCLEKTALTLSTKVSKNLPAGECKKLKMFLDSVPFMGTEEYAGSKTYTKKSPHREFSKTFDVAVQRYLHRYLNQMIGGQVLQLYTDPACHHVLCINCRNTNSFSPSPFCVCMERVGPQRIPFKIWPPHLLHFALTALPALAKLVSLDIELWKRSLLSEPLSEKVALFVYRALHAAHFDFALDPCRLGILAKRVMLINC